MKKRVGLLALLIGVALTHGASAVTGSEAEAVAGAVVPQGYTLYKSEMDDGVYEFKYRNQQGMERIEVKVSPDTAGILKIEYDNEAVGGGNRAALTDAQIAQIVEDACDGARVLLQETEIDDGFTEIKVSWAGEGVYGTFDLNGETGQILEAEVCFDAAAAADGKITEDEARAKIAEFQPGATVIKIELDDGDGHICWEGDAMVGGVKYEFKIDQQTGAIVEWERD